jgi:hypothetical protein
MVSAECKASAKAQASVNIQCTPPRLGITYAFNADADPKFKAALTTLLDVRLPALLQARSKANLVAKAGEGLGIAAQGAIKGAADELRADTKLKVYFGLQCAIDELPAARKVIEDARNDLSGTITESGMVTQMLGLGA